MHQTVELTSSGLTVATLYMSATVAVLWHRSAMTCLRKGLTNSQSWFIVGVYAAFLSTAFDNAYWAIAWTASYISVGYVDFLIKFGVYPNILFRQFFGIFTAYCHIRSVIGHTSEDSEQNLRAGRDMSNNILYRALGLGVVYSSSLYLFD